ncbi:hypothetical protein ASE75_14150 [Sphingomonas sp. Leaf17]|uniref:DUF3667 domain-containing protein n=1 Tax=Sphingomonas sp. Leaf17 TaxID=1735683 RepID=UPI0006F7328D|nr:DUF3667 domain-containing protein [Sphingomonas sp. Leaf17]KQM62755.1 hypothetical protein ASE75_14150 [Sphingomonas sp. Leaf17]
MTGDIDAAGGIITGALLAGTLDPHARGMAHVGAQNVAGAQDAAGALCLNCGTRLIGPHCHACGQSGHVHRTLGAIGHDLLHGVFHFEGRIWRTLPMLVRHPGALTRRYIAGERARFVSPLALFLFTVFLTFALFGALGPGDLGEGMRALMDGTRAEMAEGLARGETRIAALEKQRAIAVAARTPTTDIDQAITVTRRNVEALAGSRAELDADRARHPVRTGWPWLDRAIVQMQTNPGLVAYKVQSSAYKYSWALILLSTPFVALLFAWRRRFHLYDHAIFVTYSISFMSLLAIMLEVGLAIGIATGLIWTIFWLAPPVHLFAQLRGAYGLSRPSALWRTVCLLVFAAVVLTLFVAGLVAMGVSH